MKNWEEKTLEEICDINYGTRVVKNRDAGTIYPVYGGGGATFCMDTFNRENCMVVARFAMSEKCTRFVKGKFFLNDSGLTVNSKDEKLNQLFLDWQMLALNDKIYSLGRGSAQKNLNINLFKNLKIKYPLSTKEQERIVKILDKVFENIEKAKKNAEQNLNNVKELYENIQKNIFNGNFPQKKLGDICCLYQGLAINAKTKHLLVEKSSLPLLRIKDLKENTVSQYVKEEDYPINALVKENDIIYTRTGSLGLVFSGKKGILHNNSFKVVPNDEIYREYLIEYLKNPNFKRKIISFAEKAAQPDITHSIFKQQTIPIPSKEIQKAIIGKLVSIREQTVKLEQIYTQKIKDLEELKQSILQKAFNGEL